MKPWILILLLWPLVMNGQTWFPDGAVWHYGYSSGFGAQGYVRFDVIGDTVVNGQSSRKLTRTRETYDFINQQYGSETMAPVIAHEAAGVVWLYVPSISEFDTLYNLAAVPGDQWLLPPMPDPFICTEESMMIVTDTGTTMIGSVQLHWMAVNIHYVDLQGSMVIQDTILERVGTGAYMLPHDLCNSFIDGQEGGPLRCYQDVEIDYVISDEPCNFVVGVGEANEVLFRPRIFPNPADDRIWLDGIDVEGPFIAVVYDMQGVSVLSNAVTPKKGIDVSTLAPGFYTLTLVSKVGRQTTLKWLKY